MPCDYYDKCSQCPYWDVDLLDCVCSPDAVYLDTDDRDD